MIRRLLKWLKEQWYGVQEPAMCDMCGQYDPKAHLVGHDRGEKLYWCEGCHEKWSDALT